MGGCQHEPISLFDKPMPDDEKAAVQYFLSGYARRGWVICRKCGETGYWGGYGFAVRWLPSQAIIVDIDMADFVRLWCRPLNLIAQDLTPLV